ncbi:uncharacterized protein LOC144375165 isoform X2 [Ictidomys tridecemlineatus]
MARVLQLLLPRGTAYPLAPRKVGGAGSSGQIRGIAFPSIGAPSLSPLGGLTCGHAHSADLGRLCDGVAPCPSRLFDSRLDYPSAAGPPPAPRVYKVAAGCSFLLPSQEIPWNETNGSPGFGRVSSEQMGQQQPESLLPLAESTILEVNIL